MKISGAAAGIACQIITRMHLNLANLSIKYRCIDLRDTELSIEIFSNAFARRQHRQLKYSIPNTQHISDGWWRKSRSELAKLKPKNAQVYTS